MEKIIPVVDLPNGWYIHEDLAVYHYFMLNKSLCRWFRFEPGKNFQSIKRKPSIAQICRECDRQKWIIDHPQERMEIRE